MYLQKLEIQGFKSFAKRTILEFPSANGSGKGITSVVGPNGSGKSNIADAIRWVLGEQSMKTLRGKKSEDVIFYGSDKKARVGMAEVSLYLNNEDGSAPIDFSELVITRRLFRNGESEYLLNKNRVRLSDVQILLAKANFGQRTYSVIGQGMVDHFLVASQAERKEFFDEAAGVKEYQIKKNQAINQLDRTKDNLKQTEITLNELGPRYRSLARMIKRLEQRGEIETELRSLQLQYYRRLYGELNAKWQEHNQKFKELDGAVSRQQLAVSQIQKQLDSLEQEDSGQDIFEGLQRQFNQTLAKKNELSQQQLEIQNKINFARQQAKQDFIPLSAAEMASELETLLGLHDDLHNHVSQVTELSHLGGVKEKIGQVVLRLKALLKKVRPPEEQEVEIDKQLQAELAAKKAGLEQVEKELQQVQGQIANFNKTQQEKKGAFFDLQRQFSGKQSELNQLSIQVNDIKIELARLETKKEDLETEMTRQIKEVDLEKEIKNQPSLVSEGQMRESYDQIQKLKRQIELIGGIDEESVAEFGEIKDRYEFLQTQYDDLIKAITKLEEIVKNLDEEIHGRFDKTFVAINEKFGEYFKKLFNGGRASLEKIMTVVGGDNNDEESVDNEEGGDEARKPVSPSLGGQKNNNSGKKEYQYGGVDIKAVPPGKKISSLNTLSGGERAMTSIALICAIIASNPSPFVVMDEVDAALDEANSERYSAILEELSHKTQFIVVTHNRASMRRANILYGVTMGDDGVSNMLSVKLEQGEQWAK